MCIERGSSSRLERALLEASDPYLNAADLARIVQEASGAADGEALRQAAIELALELLSAGYVDFGDYTTSRVFGSRDPAAANAISAAFLSTSPSELQTDPVGEFPLTRAGWVEAIAIGEASGEWTYRWSGEPFTSPGAWSRRSRR